MTEYLLRLSFPSKDLSPNAGSPWGKGSAIRRTKAAKKAKKEAWAVGLKHGIKNMPKAPEYIVTCTFYPPGNYHYDKDGLQARMKPYLDGIADAMGVDDVTFTPGEPVIEKATKGGCVLVHIRPRTVVLPVRGKVS